MTKSYMITVCKIKPEDVAKLANVICEIIDEKAEVVTEECGGSSHCHLLLRTDREIAIKEVDTEIAKRFLSKIADCN